MENADVINSIHSSLDGDLPLYILALPATKSTANPFSCPEWRKLTHNTSRPHSLEPDGIQSRSLE